MICLLGKFQTMAEQPSKTAVALEYYKALRAETVERLKMRDAWRRFYMRREQKCKAATSKHPRCKRIC